MENLNFKNLPKIDKEGFCDMTCQQCDYYDPTQSLHESGSESACCTRPSDEQTAIKIFQKYHSAFDGDVQGACIVIADEIQKAIGGECVAGHLCMCSIERSHWWVEKDGRVFDPMGDEYKDEMCFHRREAHRSKEEFNIILPRYEKYRL